MSGPAMSFEFDQALVADASGEQTTAWLQQLRQALAANAQRLREPHGSSAFAGMQVYADMLQAAERCLPRLWMELQGQSEAPPSFRG